MGYINTVKGHKTQNSTNGWKILVLSDGEKQRHPITYNFLLLVFSVWKDKWEVLERMVGKILEDFQKAYVKRATTQKVSHKAEMYTNLLLVQLRMC